MRIIVLAGGWLLGVYLGAELGLPAALAIGAAGALLAGLLFASVTAPRRRWLFAVLAVAGALTGVLRFDLHDAGSDLGGLAPLHGSPVELRGYVDSYPERAGTALRFELRVQEARGGGDWRETEGRVLVTARPPAALTAAREHPFFHQGDALWLAGEIEAPRRSGDFDFPRYLAQQGVGSVMAFPRLELRGTGQGPWLDRALFTVRSEIAGGLGAHASRAAGLPGPSPDRRRPLGYPCRRRPRLPRLRRGAPAGHLRPARRHGADDDAGAGAAVRRAAPLAGLCAPAARRLGLRDARRPAAVGAAGRGHGHLLPGGALLRTPAPRSHRPDARRAGVDGVRPRHGVGGLVPTQLPRDGGHRRRGAVDHRAHRVGRRRRARSTRWRVSRRGPASPGSPRRC